MLMPKESVVLPWNKKSKSLRLLSGSTQQQMHKDNKESLLAACNPNSAEGTEGTSFHRLLLLRLLTMSVIPILLVM